MVEPGSCCFLRRVPISITYRRAWGIGNRRQNGLQAVAIQFVMANLFGSSEPHVLPVSVLLVDLVPYSSSCSGGLNSTLYFNRRYELRYGDGTRASLYTVFKTGCTLLSVTLMLSRNHRPVRLACSHQSFSLKYWSFAMVQDLSTRDVFAIAILSKVYQDRGPGAELLAFEHEQNEWLWLHSCEHLTFVSFNFPDQQRDDLPGAVNCALV